MDDLATGRAVPVPVAARPAATEEFGLLVEQKVQSEVLYREALALGLDKNDEIVKRRMARRCNFSLRTSPLRRNRRLRI